MRVKTFLEETFMCAPNFLVCAHLTTCVLVHRLEGTVVPGKADLWHHPTPQSTVYLSQQGTCGSIMLILSYLLLFYVY